MSEPRGDGALPDGSLPDLGLPTERIGGGRRSFVLLGAGLVLVAAAVVVVVLAVGRGPDKAGHVSVWHCADTDGMTVASYQVVNDSDAVLDYRFRVEARDVFGRRLGDASVTVDRVAAGDTVRGEARLATYGNAEECVVAGVR